MTIPILFNNFPSSLISLRHLSNFSFSLWSSLWQTGRVKRTLDILYFFYIFYLNFPLRSHIHVELSSIVLSCLLKCPYNCLSSRVFVVALPVFSVYSSVRFSEAFRCFHWPSFALSCLLFKIFEFRNRNNLGC